MGDGANLPGIMKSITPLPSKPASKPVTLATSGSQRRIHQEHWLRAHTSHCDYCLTAPIDAGLAGWAVGGNPGERHAALAMIVERAAALAGQLGVQVAEFRLLRTAEGGLDLRAMENVEVADVVAGGERVKMVVAPGLVKWGNSRGEHWAQNLVLVKAKVVLDSAEVM